MRKFYFLAIAMLFSFANFAQTTIDISAIDAAYTTTVDDELVIVVDKASSTAAEPLLSYDNPFKGLTFTEAEISFDINNYMGVDSIKVLGSLFAIFDDSLGRMYFTNGSYLGFNVPGTGFFDANLVDFGVGTDFIEGNTWKNIKLQFTETGLAMYVDDILAFDQNSTDVTITKGEGFDTNYSDVLTYLQNASTLMFGAGSWWSDNTRPDGTYWDAQFSYLKNVTFTPDFSAPDTTTAIIQNGLENNGELVRVEYYSVSGVKLTSNIKTLSPGVYLLKETYSNGVIKGSKIGITR